MRERSGISRTVAVILSVLIGLLWVTATTQVCATTPKWTVLFGGASLEGWTPIGNANWTLTKEGIVEATTGEGFLVTAATYHNFKVRVEFWTSPDANSGVFFRCQNPREINPDTAYEANIFDQRPDPSYGTGAITGVAKVSHLQPVGGKWSVMEVTAIGSHLTVAINGRITADVYDARHQSGPIALQYFGGTVRFRRVEVQQVAER